jgi:Zn-dependent protease/CBS domain-containing protein
LTTSAAAPPTAAGRRPGRSGPLGSSLRLFTVGGIDVAIHVSWLVIAALVTWSLATGFFPTVVPDASVAEDWLLGAIAAVLFFASVLAHELAHSFVAKARDLDVESITLVIFGGVSNLSGEAKQPGTEFLVAIVGPLTSFAVALISYVIAVAGSGSPAVAATFGYLAFVNAALGVFNLVPGFPLDGGRVLRSIVWSATNDLRRATEIASAAGQVVGWAMMLWGFWQVLSGNVFNGIWIAAIGWFLQNAAVASLQQTVLESRLRKLRVSDVIRPDPSGVSANTPLPELIARFMLPGARRAVAVVDDAGILAGIVTLSDVTRVVPEERGRYRVADVMTGRDRLATVTPSTPLRAAIDALGSGDFEQVPVVDGPRFVALLTRADVMREIQMRDELRIGAGSAHGPGQSGSATATRLQAEPAEEV